MEFLADNFQRVHIIAVRKKLFPTLSEDCWLLFCDNFGARTAEFEFTALEAFRPSASPPKSMLRIPVREWCSTWHKRLRPFVLHQKVRELYQEISSRADTQRIAEVASVGIGYVTGDNDFFHLRPSQIEERSIPPAFLHPTVRNGRSLPLRRLTAATVDQWRSHDDPIFLLRIEKDLRALPRSVHRYLDSDEGQRARQAYKCRVRDPWYSVPDVQVPDLFLSYMSGRTVNIVQNYAGCTCTNSVHAVHLNGVMDAGELLRRWDSPFVHLSCEIEGHPLGGGLLKMEPREAAAVLLPSRDAELSADHTLIRDGIAVLHAWRHYGGQA